MKIKRFEEIIAWQKGQDLAVEIYNIFSKIRDYGFKDQILRAVVSISNNIAEGFERNSDNEFIRFLNISKASCSEVKSMLYLSKRLNYIEQERAEELIKQCSEISMIIYGLIKSIKKTTVN